jgi:hypothetical protein
MDMTTISDYHMCFISFLLFMEIFKTNFNCSLFSMNHYCPTVNVEYNTLMYL